MINEIDLLLVVASRVATIMVMLASRFAGARQFFASKLTVTVILLMAGFRLGIQDL
jgi:hypothetical protein